MSPAPRILAPRYWGFHLLALVLVAIAVGLGNWQLDAWQARRQADAVDLTRITPVPLVDAMGPDDPFPGKLVGHPVVVEGTWLSQGTVLISNREQDAKDGYWVATPLTVGDPEAPAIMIVRGWTRSTDEVPPAPTGRAELVVNLQPGEGTGAVDDNPDDDILPQLRIADALNHVDRDLYGAYGVVATAAADGDWPIGAAAVNPGTDGLEPATLDQLPKTKATTALRNLFYAVEWWIFALFAAYVWWRWVRDELQRLDETQATDAEGPEGSATEA